MFVVRAFVEAATSWKKEEWNSITVVKTCAQEWMTQFKSISEQEAKAFAMTDKYEVICELLNLVYLCLWIINELGSQEVGYVCPKDQSL